MAASGAATDLADTTGCRGHGPIIGAAKSRVIGNATGELGVYLPGSGLASRLVGFLGPPRWAKPKGGQRGAPPGVDNQPPLNLAQLHCGVEGKVGSMLILSICPERSAVLTSEPTDTNYGVPRGRLGSPPRTRSYQTKARGNKNRARSKHPTDYIK